MPAFNFTYSELCTAINNWLLNNCINFDYSKTPDYFKATYQYTKEFKASNPMAKGTKTTFTLTTPIPDGSGNTIYNWTKIVDQTEIPQEFTCSYSTKYILDSTSFITPTETGKAKINIDPITLLGEYAYITSKKDDVVNSIKRALGFIISNCKYYSGFNSQAAFDATSQYLSFIKSSSATQYSGNIDISSKDFNIIFSTYVFPALSGTASITAKYTSESFPII